MSKIVVDSSVILALINQELVDKDLDNLVRQHSIICAVNYTEILSKLVEKNMDLNKADNLLKITYCKHIHQTDSELNTIASMLAKYKKQYNLSLGDRYCIALGKMLNLPIYTADKIWQGLGANYQVDIHLIR